MRPHTDLSLGHCSYLNTCYSEPSFSLSPSIPPTPSRFPGQQGQQGRFPHPHAGRAPVSLPSGLGAGGRGKDKAPCRYLHYEVDWDESDSQTTNTDQYPVNPIFSVTVGGGPLPGLKTVSFSNCIFAEI